MQNKIREIIGQAINAPSGDNSQPWAFKLIGENELEIFNLPGVDDTLYNFRQRGSLIAHGALLENISMLSPSLGLEAKIELLPNPQNPDLTARIIFEPGPVDTSPLLPAITERLTNRKTYKPTPLPRKFYDEISGLSKDSGIKILLIQERETILRLAKIISLNEKLILENYQLHKEIFAFIRWNKKDMEAKRVGHYIKSLELGPPQEAAFRLFSHWPIINFLNHFKISKIVTNDTKKVYGSSACFALICASNDNPLNFIATGRLLQKIWLTATKSGISMQPTTALLYLEQRINSGEASDLSVNQVKEIRQANSGIKQIFNISGEFPTMLFRMGYSDPPSGRSVKNNPIYL